jgi:hypothetical protein
LAKCFGIDHSGHVPIGYWESPAFLTEGTKVISTVWTYATEAEAAGAELRAWRGLRKILDNYRPGRVPAADCVMSLFSEGGDYRVKAEVGDYSVYLVPCSDGCQSWRVTIRVRGKGSSATAFVDTHIHRHGDTVVEMRTRRVRKPFAGVTGRGRELQDHLLQTLIDRMVAAAG